MAREQFDLIVFDWDGTLMDSTVHITRSIQAACHDLGLPVPADEAASYVIGLGLRDALQIAAPTLDPADYPRLAERYRFHYLVKDQTTELFAGVREMLQELRDQGYLLAVATGKSRVGLNRALDQVRFTSLFDGTRCADETFSKPHPAMLHELTRELGQDPLRTVMVGDTTHDLQMAINAGVAGIGVTYGAHPADSLSALAPKLRGVQRQRIVGLVEGKRMSSTEDANGQAAEAAAQAVRVCGSEELVDGGMGVRRAAKIGPDEVVVFFVRYDGRAYGYLNLNRCAHVPMELDWAEGQFFESSGLYLMCATHGATFTRRIPANA
ncbi:MAG: Similar to phosphoglycolate phosphatase, clustered with ribosomal large subunit pseudouridine synthase C [uncultured Paraburkholderia sp.]|nr:MAG: Similar to phosphoglycolate phosphatase, clustered with ribosomal large subunit pseudouridine synthase C [uncultured Paraburkholderia sp.]CAH2907779.1 MAG: Similar to phosphoglycolate phosphatase, clustered with ribosomal large subunit pseudouridine synthase C [uncultured Paraburkholderia sp.]